MKIIAFPKREKWDGKGIKKKHLHAATETEIYKQAVTKAEDELYKAELAVVKAKQKVKDAKRRHYQAQENAE